MVGVAIDDKEVPLPHELLREPLHLGDERAGGVDQFEIGLGGLLREMRTHAVGGDGDALESFARGGVDGFRADDAALPQPRHNLRVVNDVADGGDWRFRVGGVFDDVERAADAPAIAELIRDDDASLGSNFSG